MGLFSSLNRDQKEALTLLQIGTFLEYFDLMLYIHMAVLLNELEKYNPELLKKPYFVVLNKVDTDEAQENVPEFLTHHHAHAKQIRQMSAAGKIGTKELLKDICKTLHRSLPTK